MKIDVMDKFSSLQNKVSGQVITPEDAGYDQARSVFYSWLSKRPAVIIKAAGVDDVKSVVNFASENGIELAVRGGGHSIAGHSTSEGGIVLDMSGMQGLEIDAQGRTAWAEAGLTAGQYTEATAAHGLTTGFGDTGTVGIGGLTLGGGVGYLIRKYGLTIDSLLAADIVTADGKLLRVDEDNYPELFWAIRGGGGNFGVVTRFKYQLHPVSDIVGGMIFLPATAETISGFIAAGDDAPEELSGIANVMPAPPMSFLPPEIVGKTIIFGMLVYAGSGEAGEKAIAPFRKLATPLGDMMGPKKYPEIYAGPEGPHPVAGSALTMFVDKIDKSDAQLILDRLNSNDAPIRVTQLRVLGGAMARVPVMATAFAHRKSKIMVNVATLYENPADAGRHEAWTRETAKALQQTDKGAYVNFLANEGEERLRAAYPGFTWQRLREIKKKYDPENLFKLNQNIPPAR
ncbi:MAG TPA: FAD-binding oxidoreductase [Anaerolineales bacterium]|nr:FAD-binding oxidoreductase [Anaerolineales bacterium]